MKRTHIFCLLLCGLLLGPAIGVSRAGPITWEFAGTITSVRDKGDLFGGAVVAGTPFSGSFTFESTLADRVTDDPRVGTYVDPSLSFTLHIADFVLANADNLGGTIAVTNGFPVGGSTIDEYGLRSQFGESGYLSDVFIELIDSDALALSGDVLPFAPAPLSEFEVANFGFGRQLATGVLLVDGQLTHLAVVPEPGTLVLLLGGMVFAARRRERARDRPWTGGPSIAQRWVGHPSGPRFVSVWITTESGSP